jgi:hypothetical protein
VGSKSAEPLTLDAGALIALGRGDRSVREVIRLALEARLEVAVPVGALAQAWRDGRRQARLASLLARSGVRVIDLTEDSAKRSGELCSRAGTSDVVDASVVVCASRQTRGTVLTSDADDLRRLAPRLDIQRV